MRRAFGPILALVSVLGLAVSPAAGQDAAAPARPATAEETPLPDGVRRRVPDYGAPPEHTDVGDVLVWIPRVLFFPVHLVLEYGVRRPLALLAQHVEHGDLGSIFAHAMSDAVDSPPALYRFSPILRIDYGMLPAIGLGFEAHDQERRAQLGVGFAFWGVELVRGTVTGSLRLDDTWLVLDLIGSFRDDAIFDGLGWSSPSWPRARYAHGVAAGNLYLMNRFWRGSAFSLGSRLGFHRFSNSSFRQDRDVSLPEANTLAGLTAPPGYATGYTAVEPWARVVVDSRDQKRLAHASGVRADVHASFGANLEHDLPSRWIRTGASAELALEVLPYRSLHVYGLVEMVEPLNGTLVPFTEQVWLGGRLGRMPGFLAGRLMGLSACELGLSWRYALGAFLEANLFTEIGNVFAAHLRDFDVRRLRLSAGIALTLHHARDLTILTAFGTEPFAFGATVSSARLMLSIGLPP